MERIDGELTCAICLEFYQEPLLLPCGHNFCKKCIQGVIENGSLFSGLVSMGSPSSFKCPICQKGFSSRSNPLSHLPRNKALENVIDLYVSTAPVDIFDTGWNSDLEVRTSQCPRHQLPMERYCRSCNLSACEQCEVEHHQGKDVKHQHKIFPIKDVAFKHQAEIAEALTEIKKRSINLNERLQQIKQLQQHIEINEKSVMAQLDHHTNLIMSAVRTQHEELKRRLKTDFTHVVKPVEDELRRCSSLKTSIHQLMKKVSDIKRTVDSGLRISLMIGAKKQLNSLLCFDIAWSLKDDTVPQVELPTWKLDIQHVLDNVNSLNWDKHDNKMKSISTQTGDELATTDSASQESPPAKIQSCPNIKPDGANDCTSENSQKAQSSVSPSVNDIQAKAKVETTFGVNNIVTFDKKSGVKPKVRSEPKESPSVKSPENVEWVHSENLCHKESLVKVFTAEKDDLSPPDNRNKKKENKNLSPSAKCPIKKSSPRSGMNRQQQETQIDAVNKNSAKMCISTVPVDRDSRSEKASKDNTDLSINYTEVVQDITEDIDGHFKNGIDNAAVSKRAGPKTGARPKHTMTTKLGTDNCKDSETNNVCESGNTKPKSDMVKMIDKAEPMEVAYSFDYDENDRNDDQFLSQSLNKISFNTKKESREELRKSFPPDPQVARPALKPRAEVTQRLQKSKQRSPHQDAVAKFVARRRTGSPHIPKTVSSQNLQMVLNKVEFPKTLSSPALSEISAKGDCNSMVSNGFLSRNGAEKPVCMKFV